MKQLGKMVVKKSIIFLLCTLFVIALTSCADSPDNNGKQTSDNDVIPTNTSVNVTWGGYMCEANGFIYYISGSDSGYRIIRVKPDGSNSVPVTGKYDYISQLSADQTNLYFVTANEMNVLYSLPLVGGKEREIMKGHISGLQNMEGRLYWWDSFIPSGEIQEDQTYTVKLNCANINGSELKTLFSATVYVDSLATFDFLATKDGLYYFYGPDDEKCNLYRLDLDGGNKKKLNHWKLKGVSQVFYDQGKIYYLKEHFNGFLVDNSSDMMWCSVESIDAKGRIKTILDKVGYYPQDFGTIAYCGISNGIIYYLDITDYDGSGDLIPMDLHRYDINAKADTVLLNNVDMGEKAVGTIYSLHGKKINNDNNAVSGMFILCNDVYFATQYLP